METARPEQTTNKPVSGPLRRCTTEPPGKTGLDTLPCAPLPPLLGRRE
jgi:hypothetical protein